MDLRMPAATAEARVAATFRQAALLHQQGRSLQSDALCGEVLGADPEHCGAWHLRGLLAIESGRMDEGIEWIERSLRCNPNQPAAHSNIGNAWLSRQQPLRALASFDRALQLKPDYVAALYNRANALRALGRWAEALNGYESTLRLKSDHVPAHNNRGIVLLELGRAEEALDAFELCARLDPRFVPAERNRGAALLALARTQAALECFERVVGSNAADMDAWCGHGNALLALNRLEDAVASFTRALELNPDLIGALINRGHALQELQRTTAALDDYERALRNAPDSVLALNNCGNALLELGSAESALAHYDRALQLAPLAPDTLYNRAAALRELRRYQESAQGFADVLSVAPDYEYALGNLFHLRMDCCDWTAYESQSKRLQQALARNKKVINPLSLLLADSLDLQLQCAREFVSSKYASRCDLAAIGPGADAGASGKITAAGKIRVAYVSADFREHPVGYLLVGALEQHDRHRFEVIGISLRQAEDTELGRRVRRAFDRFIEVTHYSDLEVARLLRELEVDIAVDLMGLTQGMRLGIFAYRPAAVQVSFLGYAGTSGADFIDYIIADEVVIPTGQEHWYAEQIVKLPHCYLPTDDRSAIATVNATRAAADLPPEGLVLCAFGNAYKINPPVFDTWMRLLRERPGSVLWLRGIAPEACANLRREAQSRGVDAARLVFAPRVASMAEHLARQGLADLYLDTFPYNAHSTACDALWAGVPVLTCAGGSFASRVAASALTAVGLPELITHSLAEYERLALELTGQPGPLPELRARLAHNRRSAPLFDTQRYTRALEHAYDSMHRRRLRGESIGSQRGEAAQGFTVPRLQDY